jgi:hypothetical protein
MGRPDADEYRLRLEGRAELLESARLRYRSLLEALGSKPWEERLRKELDLLQEAVRVQTSVEEALAAALRRAQAEAWPAKSPTVQCLREVQELREKLVQRSAQRLGCGSGEPLLALLETLEERVLTTPRELPPAQRWSTALALLPESLPLVQEVSAFGALLALLFSRPFDPEARLAFRVDEVDALRKKWSPGEAALASAWSRLSAVDRTGGMVGELRRLAQRGLTHPPENGPERLIHAEHWHAMARRRLELLVRVRVSPVEPVPVEHLPVAWWLCTREFTSEARLPASTVLSDARAGLLELAHELWVSLRPWQAEEPPHLPDAEWERLKERARRAEPVGRSLDANRLRDVLRTFIGRRAMGTSALRGWQEASTRLEALVEQARRVDR